MRLVIFPHDIASGGATALKDKLNEIGIRSLKVYPDKGYSVRVNDTILNWGNSQRPNWHTNSTPYINHPDRVAVCANKLKTFQCLDNRVPVPDWTTSQETARKWIDEGSIVMVRQKLTGSGGEGIIVAKTKEEVTSALLYSRYFPRKFEFRLHIFTPRNGNPVIIDFTQKKKRTDFEGEHNKFVRSFANGYIFSRESVVLPKVVKDAAIKAVKQAGIDLCSVDIGMDFENNDARVFEINTASGIEATTVDRYAECLKCHLQNRPIPAAPGSEIDAPLWDGKKKGKNTIGVQPVIPSIAIAKTEPKQEATLIKPAPITQNTSVAKSSKVIKIARATDIEVIEENGKIFLYGKLDDSYYPVRLARIDGQNLTLKQIES